MRRNMFKIYSIEELKRNSEEFNNFNTIQYAMNNWKVYFNVLFFKDSLGIIVYQIEEDSEYDQYLKKKGFDEEGE